jgi:hypothetical protein
MRSFRWAFIMGAMASTAQEVLAYRKSLSKGFEIFCMIAIVILCSTIGLLGLLAYFWNSNWILIYVLCQIGATGLGILIAGVTAHYDFKVIRYNEMEGEEAIIYDPENQSLLLKDPFLGEETVSLTELYKVKGSSDVIYTGKVLVMTGSGTLKLLSNDGGCYKLVMIEGIAGVRKRIQALIEAN